MLGRPQKLQKRVAPTKRLKAKIAVEPISDEMTAYSPSTLATVPENRPPPLEDAPIHAGTPWPEAGRVFGNLLETRKNWLLPLNHIDDNTKSTANTTSPKTPIQVEPKPEGQPATSPKVEKCGWGPNCPFCKTKKKTGMVTTRSSNSSNQSPSRRSR